MRCDLVTRWYVGVCVGQAGNPRPESAAATQREQKLVQKIGVVDWNVGYHRGPHVFKRPVFLLEISVPFGSSFDD